MSAHPDYPLRQASAHGIPSERSPIARRCAKCGASFLKLAHGKTGERGIWRNDNVWFCSVECAPLAAGGVVADDGVFRIDERSSPCMVCRGEGLIERLATPHEVDNGCELGIAYDPCLNCQPPAEVGW